MALDVTQAQTTGRRAEPLFTVPHGWPKVSGERVIRGHGLPRLTPGG